MLSLIGHCFLTGKVSTSLARISLAERATFPRKIRRFRERANLSSASVRVAISFYSFFNVEHSTRCARSSTLSNAFSSFEILILLK
jgi:hypothetical protein